MKQSYNILIIDEHPMVIECYKDALTFLSSTDSKFKFKIDTATDILTAIKKVKSCIPQNNPHDLILLAISLPRCDTYKLNSGEELGHFIKEIIPNVKIIVITSQNDNIRLFSIISNLNPHGLIIKTDMSSQDLLIAIKYVISGSIYYSKSANEILRKKANQTIVLDHIDIDIMVELSNGSKMKDLQQLIRLTKSGIEKRKRLLKQKFNIASNRDRDLILSAKRMGYIK